MSGASYSAQLNVRKRMGGPASRTYKGVLLGATHCLQHGGEVGFQLVAAEPDAADF